MMQQENIPIKVGLPELLYGSHEAQLVIPAYLRNYTWLANERMLMQKNFVENNLINEL